MRRWMLSAAILALPLLSPAWAQPPSDPSQIRGKGGFGQYLQQQQQQPQQAQPRQQRPQAAPQDRGNRDANRGRDANRDRNDANRNVNRGDRNWGQGGGNDRRPGYNRPRRDYSGFQDYRRSYNSPRRFRGPTYRRPAGWYERRWTFGEFLPSLFWSSSYWLNDFNSYALPTPPYGTVWVRNGNDALLIDRDTGEIISVRYGVFY